MRLIKPSFAGIAFPALILWSAIAQAADSAPFSLIPLKQVYSFNPIPTGLPARSQSHILGAQGNLWTEYVTSLPHAEYMIFPRLCALAEVLWSSKDSRDWPQFQRRLKVDERRLDELAVNFRRARGVKGLLNQKHFP